METRFVPVDEEVREVALDPAERWRNLWLLDEQFEHVDTGESFGPGVTWSPFTWPTKADAIKDAEKQIAFNAKRGGGVHWLGAFPVEDT